MSEEEMRKAFEEWYAQERPDMHQPFERTVSDERYTSMETEWAWRAWNRRTEPEGWKLVPVEPTREMAEAFYRGQEKLLSRNRWETPFDSGYKAMLNAAPNSK